MKLFSLKAQLEEREHAERFDREAAQAAAEYAAIDEQIAEAAYAAKTGDGDAEAIVARLQAKRAKLKNDEEVARAAANTARKREAIAIRNRQQKQHDDKIKKLEDDAAARLDAVKTLEKDIRKYVPLIAKSILNAARYTSSIRDAWPVEQYNVRSRSDRWQLCMLHPSLITAAIQAQLAKAFHDSGVKSIVKWPEGYPDHNAQCPHCKGRLNANRVFTAEDHARAEMVGPEQFKGLGKIFEEATRLTKQALAKASLDGEIVVPTELTPAPERNDQAPYSAAASELLAPSEAEPMALSGEAHQERVDRRHAAQPQVAEGADFNPFNPAEGI